MDEDENIAAKAMSDSALTLKTGPMYPPILRRFKVIHAKQRYRSAGVDMKPQLESAEEVIERDSIHFGDSFVVFGNGGEYQVKTDVIAIAWEPGMRVEEITDDGA